MSGSCLVLSSLCAKTKVVNRISWRGKFKVSEVVPQLLFNLSE